MPERRLWWTIYWWELNASQGESERTCGVYKKKILAQAPGQHFNLPGHEIGNMTITVLEKVHKYDDSYRQEREEVFIGKFHTFYNGVNRQP